MFRFSQHIVAALVLSACGGGSNDDEYGATVAAANSKEAEARALGTESPCSQVQECGTLAFLQPAPVCSGWTYKPYSLVSASAGAASAAAAQQVALAGRARVLAPSTDILCPAVVEPAPTLACVTNTCKASP